MLIIEDNLDAAESLRMLLEVLGYRVQTASDGIIGLRETRALRPDVVLCDIGLPGGTDGYDVARAIRADPQLHKMFLAALTGYGQDEDKRKAREAGFDAHITKPPDPRTLQKILSEVETGNALGREGNL